MYTVKYKIQYGHTLSSLCCTLSLTFFSFARKIWSVDTETVELTIDAHIDLLHIS